MKNAFHKLFRIGSPERIADDPRPILWWGFGIITVFVGGGFAWMALAPLDGAVVSEGVVKVRTDRIAVQHPKGGVVGTVFVRDGATVKAGDALLEITEPGRLAAYEAVRYQHDSEHARNARLRAEQVLAARVDFPAELAARRGDARVAQILKQEEAVFRNRRFALDEAEQAMRRSAVLIRQERAQLGERAVTQKEAAAIVGEQLSVQQELEQKGFVSRYKVLDLQRAQAQEKASLGELEADRLRADQRLAELELRVAELRNRFFETVSQELKSSDERLFQLSQQLLAQKTEIQRDTISAPVDGVVMNLKSLSAGTAVGPLQPVMELVPSGDAMFVEAAVAPKDVRHVRPGGRVEVQVAGWNRRTMPLLEGAVEYISADAVRINQELSAFVVRLKVDKAATAGITEPLKPGMQTTVYFRTGSRTVLDYLLEPVIDSMRSAFREPV